MAAQEQESLYSDSVCSSPRSVATRGNDDEPRVRFMCSYGGRILPRPHDNQLRYVGGETRIVAVSRTIAFSILISKLSKLCGNNVTVKYQLPNEDLDALISVTMDEDLENMMEEYDRLNSGNRSSRLRLFLFPAKLENASSLGSLLEGSKREHWFLDALNGVPILTRRRSEVSSMASEVPDYLFGLDSVEDWDRDEKPAGQPGPGKSRLNSQYVAEVQSAPGSPIPISSPYGSTSSAPPSIDTHLTAELAAKAQKFGLHPGMSDPPGAMNSSEDQTTKLVSKPDPEKISNYSPEVPVHESPKVEMAPPEDVKPVRINVPVRSDPMTGPSVASLKRENSGSNLSANGDEPRTAIKSPDGGNRPLQTDEVYKPPGVMNPSEQYIEYTQAPQFVGQPTTYWQMHEDNSGQVYYVAAGAATPAVLQSRPPVYMPVVQRIPSLPGSDVSIPGPYPANPGVLPVQKLAGALSIPGPYPAKSAGKAPLYRGPRPVSTMMMRPPVPVISSDHQYAYQQVGYDQATNVQPQQIYYTQKPTVMNPQYHPPIRASVDLQASQETVPEGAVFGRVSGSI